jgi:UDP-glucose 4-epimerase
MSDFKKTILVTGAAGFIGSHVCRHLMSDGFNVVGLDDLSGGFADQVPRGVHFVQGSITDEKFVFDLFARRRFAAVYHLAAYAAEGLSHFIKHFNYTNNILGSVNLINAAVNHEVKLFVFTSSIAVYGHNQLPMHEDLVPSPEDPYGIAKYAVELDLRESHEMFGLNYVIFRPHNVYGEHQNLGDPYRNVIGIFMNRILQGQPLTIFGDGSQTRAFSYIDDVAPIIASVGNQPEAWNQVFNVGADTPYEIRHLAQVVCDEFEISKPNIHFLPERKEVKHAYCSHEKIRRFFPATARGTKLEKGIRRMAAWARKKGARTGVPFGKVEVARNMPKSWAALTSGQA